MSIGNLWIPTVGEWVSVPIITPKEIEQQPYEQLELADGGSVERQGYSYAGLVTDYIKKKKIKQ